MTDQPTPDAAFEDWWMHQRQGVRQSPYNAAYTAWAACARHEAQQREELERELERLRHRIADAELGQPLFVVWSYELVRDAILEHLHIDEDDVAEEALLVEAIEKAANRETVESARQERDDLEHQLAAERAARERLAEADEEDSEIADAARSAATEDWIESAPNSAARQDRDAYADYFGAGFDTGVAFVRALAALPPAEETLIGTAIDDAEDDGSGDPTYAPFREEKE